MTATKTKRKGLFLALPILALLFLISTAMTSGTFAKYASEFKGDDTALIAKWHVIVKDADSTFTGSTGLDLWKHIYNTKMVQKDGENYIIAPGVQGTFTVDVNNDSDVDANIDLTFTKLDGPDSINLEYSVDGTTWVTLSNLATQLADKFTSANPTLVTDATPGDKQFVLGHGKEVSQIVQWRWEFEKDENNNGILDAADIVDTDGNGITDADEADTSITGASRVPYTVQIDIKATQVAPSSSISATVSNITLQNATPYTAEAMTITITGDTLKSPITTGDLSKWITNLPNGLTATAVAGGDANHIKISISGTPTISTAGNMRIVIPGSYLNNGTDIIVTTNNSANYAL